MTNASTGASAARFPLTTASPFRNLGWGGLTNGALLRKAESEFDVFITGDRNLSFQQQLSGLDIAVFVLHAKSTQLRHTIQLMPRVLNVLPTIKPGEVIQIASQP